MQFCNRVKNEQKGVNEKQNRNWTTETEDEDRNVYK